jgi:hypothetical protein
MPVHESSEGGESRVLLYVVRPHDGRPHRMLCPWHDRLRMNRGGIIDVVV